MLSWYEPLYIGGSTGRYARKIRRRLDSGKTDVGHYLITIASNGTDELDIVQSGLLSQTILRSRLPMIVGLASGRKEALDLAAVIAEDCLRETGDVRIRKWLTEKAR